MHVFRHYINAPTIVLVVLEGFACFGMFYLLSYLLILNLGGGSPSEKLDLLYIIIFPVITLLMMVSGGLYNGRIFFNGNLLVRVLATFIIILVLEIFIIEVYSKFISEYDSSQYASIVLVLLLLAPLAITTRKALISLKRLDIFRWRILIVGTDQSAKKIDKLVHQNQNDHIDIVAYVMGEEGIQCHHLTPIIPLDFLDDGKGLVDFIRERQIKEIVVAMSDRRGLPVQGLLQCKLLGIRVTEFSTFWERESGQIDLDALRPSWFLYSDGFKTGWFRQIEKRGFDIISSLAFLMLTLPVTIATAIAIKLDSRGPIFYRQERVGQFGRIFEVLKFRSMDVNAENDGIPRWSCPRDDRVTRIGRLIRKTRIDEIPQVINVLKGDMSFVGPRPERPFFVDTLGPEIPFYNERMSVKPGITGWAQINYHYGASVEDTKIKLAYDLYYIKNSSIFLDLLVLLRTVGVVIASEGAR